MNHRETSLHPLKLTILSPDEVLFEFDVLYGHTNFLSMYSLKKNPLKLPSPQK